MPTAGNIPSLEFERAFWRDGFRHVAGLDEAGRGALAGPVVAAVVILPPLDDPFIPDWTKHKAFHTIARANDSKLLTPRARERLFEPICSLAAAYGIGSASQLEIDTLNILRASRLAMHRALAALPVQPDALLLDALVLHELQIPQQGIIHGDAIALSIAAASILAKVARDRLMRELDRHFPHYHFAQNKGYGTAAHLRALRQFGPSQVHRHTFAPVASARM
jgi:ribonuclease HII